MNTKIRCVAMAAMLATAGGLQAQTRDTREPVAPPAQRTYIVQLAAAPLATYDGTVRGLAATRSSTGARLNTRSSAARAYTGYLDRQRSTVLCPGELIVRPACHNRAIERGGAGIIKDRAQRIGTENITTRCHDRIGANHLGTQLLRQHGRAVCVHISKG